MARASASAQCDLVASYVDGVHVKIAEAYKPPRKIGLPAAYNNRLSDVSRVMYDFGLERSVLDKMNEWREARRAVGEARRVRLEKRMREKEEAPPTPPPSECVKRSPMNSAPAPETTILKPQPLSLPANDLRDDVKTNGLDFADFDNDTSSPFDNMELKTINDMEELAQVLQPRSQWVPAGKLENIINELTMDETPEIRTEEKVDGTKIQAEDRTEESTESVESHRSVSAIVRELRRELERPIVQNWKPWPDLESPRGTPKRDDSASKRTKPPDPLTDLTEEERTLARHLSDMGFPLSRAARAVRDLGSEDNKRVVEYLLAVQSLEENGISGDDAEKALALTQYDQSRARIYYESLCTLRDLGFPEDEASLALLKCDIDRDRALDLLIA